MNAKARSDVSKRLYALMMDNQETLTDVLTNLGNGHPANGVGDFIPRTVMG